MGSDRPARAGLDSAAGPALRVAKLAIRGCHARLELPHLVPRRRGFLLSALPIHRAPARASENEPAHGPSRRLLGTGPGASPPLRDNPWRVLPVGPRRGVVDL